MCCYVKIRSNAQHVVSHKWTKLVLKLAIKRQLWEVREDLWEKLNICDIKQILSHIIWTRKNDNVFYVCLCHNSCHAYRIRINFSILIHYFLNWYVSYLICNWNEIYKGVRIIFFYSTITCISLCFMIEWNN